MRARRTRGASAVRAIHLVELLEQVLAELDVVRDAVDGRVVDRGDGLEGGRDASIVCREVHEAIATLAVGALIYWHEEDCVLEFKVHGKFC